MSTKITDSFGRADENPLASPYLKTASGFSGNLKLATNQVLAASGGTDSWFYDNGNTYDTNSQWAVFTVGAAGGKDFGVVLHMTSTGSGYFMTGASAPGNIQLFKVVNGAFGSFILDIATQTYTAGDQFYFENVAGALKLYRGTSSAGTLIGSTTDGTPLTGGKPGIGSNDGTGGLSFFQAGDFTASTPTITVQPVNRTGYPGATASFNITATTSGGTLHYQWKDDGSNVGTDSSSYTTAAGTPSDNGSLITCVVTDDNGSITSLAAVWTVLPASSIAWTTA